MVTTTAPVTTAATTITQDLTASTTSMMTTTEFTAIPTVQSTTTLTTTNSMARSSIPTTTANSPTVDDQATEMQSDIPTPIYSPGETLLLIILFGPLHGDKFHNLTQIPPRMF